MKNRMAIRSIKFVLLVIICIYPCGLHAQQEGPVYDNEINVESFEEMRYPPLPLVARIQGIVVVRVKMDDHGNVITASGISGDKRLLPDALANAKKWVFQTNAGRTAIIVYEFRVAEGVCNSPNHLFVFRAPNVASITGCTEPTQP